MNSFNTDDLAPRDRELLALIQEHRFITTGQACRFLATRQRSQGSALRLIQQRLKRLRDRHLTGSLERRVGGWRSGSDATIWHISVKGKRLLGIGGRRERVERLSTTFLTHALTVTETRLVISETVRTIDAQAVLHGEPECWRTYRTLRAGTCILRPDLEAIIIQERYEDHYFIEVDLASENPARVARTCQRYAAYRQTRQEQQRNGIFPIVLWVAPTMTRVHSISAVIAAAPTLDRRLFRVITLDQLPELIRRGPSEAAGTIGTTADGGVS
jgi:hypothetical protein